MRKLTTVMLVAFVGLIGLIYANPGHGIPVQVKDDSGPKAASARKTIRMLDDLYKTAIVLITKTYVEDDSSVPAISAAQALWHSMDEKGWHETRLIDATGEPYDDENVAKSDFEKMAIKQLTSEKPYIDKIVEKDGIRYLEALTQVPVVMDKCVMCHANYENVEPGVTIGAISYRIAID